MSTILDELIVTLGLSSKGLASGAAAAQKKLEAIEDAGAKAVLQTDKLSGKLDVVGEKALDASVSAEKHAKATKKVSEESETATRGVSALSGKLASFLALIGGGVAIRSFIKDAIETNTQLYFMARNLDMTTQSLFALGAAGKLIGVGGAAQSLAASLASIPGQLLSGQNPQLLRILARAGVPFEGISQEHQEIGLARFFATMPRARAYGLGTSEGLSAQQMQFLLLGPEKIAAYLKAVRDFSPTDQEANQAAKFTMQMGLLDLQFKKIGYDLLEKASPFLEKFFDLLSRFGAWAQQHETLVASFLAALAAGIGAVSIATIALGSSLIGFDPVVLAIVAGISALSGVIAFLVQDYQKWAQGQKSTFDWEAFAQLVRDAGDAFDYLKNKIGELENAWNRFARTPLGKAITSAAGWLANKIILPGALNNTSDFTRQIGQGIAQQEGFNTPGSVSQRANNPGDIEWGDFARRHGATSYVTAAGGKQIAVFPDTGMGWDALYALWDRKMASGQSVPDALDSWSGHTPGYAAAVLKNAKLPPSTTVAPKPSALAAPTPTSSTVGRSLWQHLRDWNHIGGNWLLNEGSHLWNTHSNPGHLSSSTDNSTNNHVGQIVVQSPAQVATILPGMDLMSYLANYGQTG